MIDHGLARPSQLTEMRPTCDALGDGSFHWGRIFCLIGAADKGVGLKLAGKACTTAPFAVVVAVEASAQEITQQRYGRLPMVPGTIGAMSQEGQDRLPLVPAVAALDAIEEITDRQEAHGEALLRALLCAAWPTQSAQNQ